MTDHLAPVVVFAYNRPDHLRQTLSALAEAELAREARVRVYADGPRDEAARAGVDAVHRVLDDPVWRDRFAAFEVRAATANKGLATSIIEGVTEVVEAAGRVIVLEDDLIVSRDFLRFMNDALDFYRDDPTIGSISGFCPLKAPPRGYPHDVMRVPRNCSTGWATWSDRWREVDWSARDAARLYRDPAFRRSFNAAGADRLAGFGGSLPISVPGRSALACGRRRPAETPSFRPSTGSQTPDTTAVALIRKSARR